MRRAAVATALMVGMVALAGCGGSDDGEESRATGALSEEATVVGDDEGTTSATEEGALTFGAGSYDAIAAALVAANLRLCFEYVGGWDVSGSYESMQWTAVGDATCPDDPFQADDRGLIVADAYGSPGELANGIQQSQDGFGDGLVGYHWEQFIVSVRQGAHPDTVAAFEEAVATLEGAEAIYDRRWQPSD